MIASTPSSLPSRAALDGSARSLLEKFCSVISLSSALRSITEYLPSLTSRSTSMSAMPLPTSWLLPKISATDGGDGAVVEVHNRDSLLILRKCDGRNKRGKQNQFAHSVHFLLMSHFFQMRDQTERQRLEPEFPLWLSVPSYHTPNRLRSDVSCPVESRRRPFLDSRLGLQQEAWVSLRL